VEGETYKRLIKLDITPFQCMKRSFDRGLVTYRTRCSSTVGVVVEPIYPSVDVLINPTIVRRETKTSTNDDRMMEFQMMIGGVGEVRAFITRKLENQDSNRNERERALG